MKHEILVGDVLAGLRAMPDASVQCVVTSPPYWGLRVGEQLDTGVCEYAAREVGA